MSDLATRLRHELIELNEAVRRAAHTAVLLNHPQAEALRMMASFTERLVSDDGATPRQRH